MLTPKISSVEEEKESNEVEDLESSEEELEASEEELEEYPEENEDLRSEALESITHIPQNTVQSFERLVKRYIAIIDNPIEIESLIKENVELFNINKAERCIKLLNLAISKDKRETLVFLLQYPLFQDVIKESYAAAEQYALSLGKEALVKLIKQNQSALEEKSPSKASPLNVTFSSSKSVTKSDLELTPVSTLGDGDCAFHAAFGSWDPQYRQFISQELGELRKKITIKIKAVMPQDKLYPAVKEAIQQIVLSERRGRHEIKNLRVLYQGYLSQNQSFIHSTWEAFEKELKKEEYKAEIIEYIEKQVPREKKGSLNTLKLRFDHVLNEEDDTLRSKILSFKELDVKFKAYDAKSKEDFSWDQYLTQGAIEEYAELIGSPGYWLLPGELEVLAQVLECSIELYIKDGKSQAISKTEVYNPNANDSVAIYFNGVNHYERMLTKTEWQQLNIFKPTSLPSLLVDPHHLKSLEADETLLPEFKFFQSFLGLSAPKPVSLPEKKGSLDETKKPSLSPDAPLFKKAVEVLKQQRLIDWEQESQNFIPLRASWYANSEQDFELENEIQRFLLSDKKVLLILGNSGSGKSLYTQGLVARLWEIHSFEKPIPIWISLSALKNPLEDAIEETLEGYGLTPEDIESLRQTQSFIFILDAYDEMRSLKNLYVTNHLECWNAKIIITCRREYLYQVDNYQSFLVPYQKEKALHAAYQELVIRPFNAAQVENYCQHYIKNPLASWKDIEKYKEALEEVPGLNRLITTPFILKLALEVLPVIMKRFESLNDLERRPLTQAALYDVFIEQWFLRQEKKLKEARQIKPEEDIKLAFWAYAKELAKALHQEGLTQIFYQPNVHSDLFGKVVGNRWAQFFDTKNERTSLLQTVCLVREVSPHHYAFIHDSLQEYFVTRNLYEELIKVPVVFERNSMVLEGNTISNSNNNINKDNTLIYSKQHNKGTNSLNERLLVKISSIIQFMADRVTENEEYKQSLFERVYVSRNNPEVGIAAANAITILNRARVSFSGLDLSKINIPSADLSYGIFDGTNFQSADLSGVKFQGAWLHQANFEKTIMKETNFGELPSLKLSNVINCLCYSKDGLYFAVGSKDIVLFDVANNYKIIHTFKGHTKEIKSIAFSPDGKLLASGSGSSFGKDDPDVYLWSAKKGVLLHRFKGHTSDLTSVAFSLDGYLLASGGEDNRVRLWDIKKYSLVYCFTNHIDTVNSVEFSPTGQLLASGDNNNIFLWDLKEYKILHRFQKEVTSLKFSVNGQLLAWGSGNTIQLWDTQKCTFLNSFKGHLDHVTSVAFAPDSKLIASGSWDKTIRLWDLEGNTIHCFEGHTGWVEDITFSQDGQWIVSGSWDHTVHFWDAKEYTTIPLSEQFEHEIGSVAFSVNGHFLAASVNKRIHVWKMDNYEKLPYGFESHTAAVACITFSPGGRFIASGSQDSTVRLWNIKEGKVLYCFKGHKKGVTCIAFSHNGQTIASGSDEKVFLWNVKEGKVLQRFREREARYHIGVTELNFSRDGRALISIFGPIINVWNVESYQLINRFNSGVSYRIAISPDCQLLAIENFTEHMIGRQNSDEISLFKVDFSNENEAVNSSLNPRNPAHRLKGHDLIEVICFSPDGQLLASGGASLQLWSSSTGRCLVGIDDFPADISCIRWIKTLQGLFITTASKDKIVRYWGIDEIEKQHTLRIKLLWQNRQTKLMAFRANIHQIRNLTSINQALLEQLNTTTNSLLKPLKEDEKKILFPNKKQSAEEALKEIIEQEDALLLLFEKKQKSQRIIEKDRERIDFLNIVSTVEISDNISNNKMTKQWQEENFYQRLFVNELDIIQFLANRAKEDKVYKQFLFEQVYASRNNPKTNIAAANAITILNYARISFAGMDFTGIQISGANLASALLDHTNFSKSNLKNVNLQDAWLRGANLQGACLDDVYFGEEPNLQHEKPIIEMVFTQDWDRLAVSVDNKIYVWKRQNSELIKILEGHEGIIKSISFGVNDTLLASGGMDTVVRVWDMSNGQISQTLVGHKKAITSVAFSSYPYLAPKIGNKISSLSVYLASGSEDNTVLLWDITNKKPLQVLKGHTREVTSVAFSSDGYLASGSDDCDVRIWNILNGQILYILSEHEGCIIKVKFNPNGYLFSTSRDGTIRIWDVISGEELRVLKEERSWVFDLSFSSDGKTLATVYHDNFIKVWNVSSGQIVQVFHGTIAIPLIMFVHNLITTRIVPFFKIVIFKFRYC